MMALQRQKIEAPRTPSCSASPATFGAALAQYCFPQRRKAAKKHFRREAPIMRVGSACGAKRVFAALRLCGKRLGLAAALRVEDSHERLDVLGVSILQRWSVS
jgi:hypothetical protein